MGDYYGYLILGIFAFIRQDSEKETGNMGRRVGQRHVVNCHELVSNP